ncbi:MFS transporter [Dactylosporangium sp. CA-092794]|uniref:MFS transporter n=1 Tax=Dactylosporangium sp. CA-092794 TaxID=3239929 RepID=UPI003D937820
MAERIAVPETSTGRSEVKAGGGAIALFVIVGFQLMVIVDGTIVNVALPAIQHSLGFTVTGLSWVVNAYVLAVGGLLLLGGRAGDVFGRRRIFVVGVALFTASSLVAGLATTPGWLIAARAVQGVGAALAGPSTLALIANNFAEGPERHRALGAFSAAAGGGGSLGIIAGGMLTEWASWRWVMFVNVPVGLAVLLLTPRHVRESERHPGRFDVAGALTSGVALTALAYGCVRGAGEGWGDRWSITAFAAAALLLLAFVAVERRAAAPIVPFSLLSQRNRTAAYVNMLVISGAMIGVFYFLTLFLQETLRFSALETGFAFLTMTVPLFATARIAAALLARTGAKPVTVVGTALITAGIAWLSFLDAGSGFAGGVLGPLVLIGAGIGLTFMPLNSIILANTPPKHTGAASGLLQAMQRVGASVGLAVLVAIAAQADGQAEQAARAYQASTVLVGIALCIALFVITRPARSDDETTRTPTQ